MKPFGPGFLGSLAGAATLRAVLWAFAVIYGSSADAAINLLPSGTSPLTDSAGLQQSLWARLQAEDLHHVAANLRRAGFPIPIVRAIVSAQVELQFAARMRKEVTEPVLATPFWQPDPTNTNVNPKGFEAYMQINRDRAKLMLEVLSDDYFLSTDNRSIPDQRRRYGDLNRAKIDVVRLIESDYADITAQLRAALRGIILPEDRERLAVLEREKRSDLAALLTPSELEDYELRSSAVTERLRPTLTLMEASEQEFRAIYGIHQRYVATLYPTGLVALSANHVERVRAARTAISAQLRIALGLRYAAFARANNPEFQQLYRLARRENISVDTATAAFEISFAAMQESRRIFEDARLPFEQKRVALQNLARATRTQLKSKLGSAAGGAYLASAYWLVHIEQGGALSTALDGTDLHYGMLPGTPTGYAQDAARPVNALPQPMAFEREPRAAGLILELAEATSVADSTRVIDYGALPIGSETWAQLYSTNLREFVSRLRQAGFPGEMIRAILFIQLDDLFGKHRRLLDPDRESRPFWLNSALDSSVNRIASWTNRKQLKMLKVLLGSDGDALYPMNIAADQRRLGGLPPDKMDAIKQILYDFDDRRVDLAASNSYLPDPVGAAALDQAQREAVARLLTAQELEEFDLRNSKTADALRAELSVFGPTEGEFRAIFRLRRGWEGRFPVVYVGPLQPDQLRQRTEMQNQLKEQIKAMLSPERAAEYERAIDYDYGVTSRLVARLDLPRETTAELYVIRGSVQERIKSLASDRRTPVDARRAQVVVLAKEAERKVTALLGERGFSAYQEYGGSWMRALLSGE